MIRTFTGKLTRAVRKLIGRTRAEHDLRALADSACEPTRLLGRALLVGLQSGPGARVPEAIGPIEQLRAELLESDEPVEMPDFGAGSVHDAGAGEVRTSTVGSICRGASKPPHAARLLYEILAQFKPATALELGAAVGISAAYESAALAGHGGRLVTLEGAPALAAIARRTLDRLGADNVEIVEGKFSDTLPGVLDRVGPIGYAFIDGHHDEQATQEYFAAIRPHLATPAVVVLDDIGWSAGMTRAWQAVRRDPAVRVSVSLGTMGVCIVGDEAIPRQAVNVWVV